MLHDVQIEETILINPPERKPLPQSRLDQLQELVLSLRTVLPPDAMMNRPPDYSAEDLAELVRLLHPMRLYHKGEWLYIDLPDMLARLRSDRREWLAARQEELDAQWKATGAYQQLARERIAAASEEHQQRRGDRARDHHRDQLADQRYAEVLGYTGDRHMAASAAAQVAAEGRNEQ